MRKICVVTGTRAEYGYLRGLIGAVHRDAELELQLVVSGAHLLAEQGHSIDRIREDGYPIAAIVDPELDNSSDLAIASTMSRYAEGFADAFNTLKPDVLFVLGDRYELLPICSAAFMMRIPIAHISGGDVTEGALDDGIRNAVTMLATYHFPGTADSAKNIARMRGNDENVFTVGEPSLDFYTTNELLTRDELARELGLDPRKKWILLTWHPETKESLSYNMAAIQNMVAVLQTLSGFQAIMTKANMDYGGKEINDYLESVAGADTHRFKLFSSLGQLGYLSLMSEAALVIGNSSSGIVETPFLSAPAVNIGNRQKGRHQCQNIIQSAADAESIQKSVIEALERGKKKYPDSGYWGEGKSVEKMMQVLHGV